MCQDMRCWELVELGLGELRGGLWAQAGQPESPPSVSSPHLPETRAQNAEDEGRTVRNHPPDKAACFKGLTLRITGGFRRACELQENLGELQKSNRRTLGSPCYLKSSHRSSRLFPFL